MATLQNILQLAKLGDPKAIAVLMNRHLQPKGITAKAGLRDGCLQVLLEAASIPDQSIVVFVRKGLTALGTEAIKRVRVYGKQTGEEVAAWIQEFELVTQIPISPRLSSGGTERVSTQQLKSEASQLTQKPSLSPRAPNLSPLASSTPTKTRKNLEGILTKKLQFTQTVAGKRIKFTSKIIQDNMIKFEKFYHVNKKILGISILSVSLLVTVSLVFQVIEFREEYKEGYKKDDCEHTYTVMFNMIKQAKNDVNKLPLDRKGLEAQANRIDKLVLSLESKYIQLKDNNLKEITNQFISEAKVESDSLRKIAVMEEAEAKTVASSTEDKLGKKIEFENERSMESLLNQISLINDGANYCR